MATIKRFRTQKHKQQEFKFISYANPGDMVRRYNKLYFQKRKKQQQNPKRMINNGQICFFFLYTRRLGILYLHEI